MGKAEFRLVKPIQLQMMTFPQGGRLLRCVRVMASCYCFRLGLREMLCEARAKAWCQEQGVDSGQQSITPTHCPFAVKDSLSHIRRPSKSVTTVSACKAVAPSKTRINSWPFSI